MTQETFPRWGLTPVEFMETDTAKIKSAVISGYEKASGRTLAAGDPVRLFLLTLADVIVQLRVDNNIAAQQNLLSYAQGDALDALGLVVSCERLPESKAVTTLRFTLAQKLGNDYPILKGFEVTNGSVIFATDKDLIIPAGETVGEISATCTASGEFGNDYLAGQIATIVTPMTYLAKAENITTSTGGADAESDADYAERIRYAANTFSVAGSVKAYEAHAMSVSSAIIDVMVHSPTAGYVDIYPLMEGGELPSDDVLSKVAEYLNGDTIRPLTDFVQVKAPTAVEYEINVDYYIDKANVTVNEAIQNAVADAVENYRLWQQTKMGRDITPDKLICDVMTAGAARIDFSTLKPSAWVELQDGQVAQCTKVAINCRGYKDE